ncbi:MAG: hypothetical protein BWY78_00972 [Alphaproteobacteria bacterium ADurb.Bin438]|nr:MAG: hypothetical protein BWY78_00972 [Alphaproteobacteria bacterium ADurb.Bin438]
MVNKMDQISSIGQLITNLFILMGRYLAPCWVCGEGFAIIKNRLGRPIIVYKDAGLYWKVPCIEVFDVVDLRKQVHYLYSHSVQGQDAEKYIFPYNITFDAEVTFAITNPLIIYLIKDDKKNSDDSYKTIEDYIDINVHDTISKVIDEHRTDNGDEKYNIVSIQRKINEKYKSVENKSFTIGKQYDAKTPIYKKIMVFLMLLMVSSVVFYPSAYIINILFPKIDLISPLHFMYGIYAILINMVIIVMFWLAPFNQKEAISTKKIRLIDCLKIDKVVLISLDNNLGLRKTI